MPPTGARDIRPPPQVGRARRVTYGHLLARRREYDRPGNEILRRRAREVLGLRRLLGHGEVASGLDELTELVIGDLVNIHPEATDPHAVHRTGIPHRIGSPVGKAPWIGTPQGELSSGNPGHAGGPGPSGCGLAWLRGCEGRSRFDRPSRWPRRPHAHGQRERDEPEGTTAQHSAPAWSLRMPVHAVTRRSVRSMRRWSARRRDGLHQRTNARLARAA